MTDSENSALKVLIVRIGAMGDVLHGMPAVAGLRAALPGCCIGWAVEEHLVPLLRDAEGVSPLVDRVHVVYTKRWGRKPSSWQTLQEIAELRRELRAGQYDVCIDLQGSVKSGVVAWMSGSRRIVGSSAPKEWPAKLVYGVRVREAEPQVIQQAAELVRAGLHAPLHPAIRAVELPADATAERWVEDLGVGRGFALLSPTAGWGGKEWGIERFGALAQELEARGVTVLVNAVAGFPSEAADTVAAVGGRVVSSTLPQMIALVRRAGIVIGGDSGPVHMAAALGRPVVMLFGATDPARNGPEFVGARATVLRDPSSVTDYRHHRETDPGLKRIRVEEVLAAALALMQQTQGE